MNTNNTNRPNIFKNIFVHHTAVWSSAGGTSGDKYRGSADDWSITVFVIIIIIKKHKNAGYAWAVVAAAGTCVGGGDGWSQRS